jgi:cell division septation protein DedD
MSMMLTFRAGKFVSLVIALALITACSREQQDWRSAEAADTVEGYGQFLKRHPDSELATEAHTRIAQLSEDLEWQHASTADTVDAYRQFLAEHPNGKWAQEARIRMENFALGAQASAGSASSGAVPAEAPPAGSATAMASPGELAQAQASTGALVQSPTPAQASPGEPPQVSAGPHASPSTPAEVAAPSQTIPAMAASAPSQSGEAGSEGYGVQLGAFTSESAAASEWQQLTVRFRSELYGLAPHVVEANTATGRLFRLQAQVADELRARALCDLLKKQAQACVPVLPH